MDAIISIAIITGLLIGIGSLIGLADRRNFHPVWLFAAAALVIVNDALLTRLYGALPDLLAGSSWNWQGKALALAATLAIAALPGLGWQRAGLTLRQAPGSWRACVPVALLYCLFFTALALALPGDDASAETLAFQLTMPSLEEESFYRGLLLLTLCNAFSGQHQRFGVAWSWGAMLSCLLFGLAHALSFSDDSLSIDPIIMLLTAVPSLLAVWLRLRTGSILLPVLLHSVGNSISLLI